MRPRQLYGVRCVLTFVATALLACGDDGNANQIVRVEVTPSTLLLTAIGTERQLSAQAFNAAGELVDEPITWTSSTPAQVSVDAAGKVQAASLGSGQVFAEVGGTRSAPALVVVAEPMPGTTLVTDAQVAEVGQPLNRAAGEYLSVGTQYEVKLRGVAAAPAAGTIVIASETAPVAGRVVSTRPDGDLLAVVLELVALPDLLRSYDIDWAVDLSAYELVFDDEPGAKSARARPRAAIFEDEKLVKKPLTCTLAAAAKVESSFVDLKISSSPTVVIRGYKGFEATAPGHTKVALVGDLAVTGSLGFRASAGFEGKAECRLVGRIIIPWGPWALMIAPAIPVGIGFTIEGKLTVATLELMLEGRNGAKLELGFECGPGDMPCRSLDQVDAINELKPRVTVPSSDNMRVELSGKAYLLTGLDAVALSHFAFSIVEATFGPKQEANLAFTGPQARDETYASSYGLSLELDVRPGSDLAAVIEKATGENTGTLGFNFSPSLPIARSPEGTLAVDKTSVGIGAKVNVTVDLDPATVDYFVLGYNVESIEIYRQRDGESEYQPLQSIPVSASAQTRFQWEWVPQEADLGKNKLAAFVKTTMPLIELEIAPSSIHEVEVKCFTSGPRSGPAVAATCVDSWTGTATGINGPVQEMSAQVTFKYDPEQNPSPFPGLVYYYGEGNATISYYDIGDCSSTASPTSWSFTRGNGGLLIIDYNTDPPSYSGSGLTMWTAAWDHVCTEHPEDNRHEPMAPVAGEWFLGEGTLEDDGQSIRGHRGAPGESYQFTWNFARD